MPPSANPEATSFVQVMQDISVSGVPQADLAKAVGASVRTVQTWSAGTSKPRGVKVQRLLDIQLILNRLADIYTEEGVRIWLNSRNERLDLRRPLDLLGSGEVDAVLREVESLHGGW